MVKKWEHKIVYDPKEEDLNKLGDEGWELVSVTDPTTDIAADFADSVQGTVTAYLKREKTE